MNTASRLLSEKALRYASLATVIISTGLAIFVFYSIGRESLDFFIQKGFFAYFSGEGWAPSQGHYDLTPMIVGTLYATFFGLLIATPAGIGLGAFSVFYAPPALASTLRISLGLLAGLPSVVFGLFGLSAIVPKILRYQQPGVSLLAGGIVLALMTLPTIAALSEAAFRQVDKAPISGAYALGLSRRTAVFGVALRAARAPLFGAVLLAVGRALGEAMAVLMVMGNVSLVPKSIFAPARTLTMLIASEMDESDGLHRASLFGAGFLLLIGIGALTLLIPGRSRNA
jgi:phosphate transport system permease protein